VGGERAETYSKNFKFLKEVLNRNLLLRRINIRQVVYLKGEKIKIDREKFKKFKRRVNEEINKPMLEKFYLKDLF